MIDVNLHRHAIDKNNFIKFVPQIDVMVSAFLNYCEANKMLKWRLEDVNDTVKVST